VRKLDLDYKKRVNEKATGANLNMIFCVFINTILLKIQCQTYSILRFKKKKKKALLPAKSQSQTGSNIYKYKYIKFI
jgi:hypothetical protein